MNSNVHRRIRRNSAISILVVITLSSLFGGVVVFFSYQHHQTVAFERAYLTAECERLLDVAIVTQEAQRRLTDLKFEFAKRNERIPEILDFARFYDVYSALAAQHEVTLRQMKPGAPVSDSLYTRSYRRKWRF